jgi:hypothetical protein
MASFSGSTRRSQSKRHSQSAHQYVPIIRKDVSEVGVRLLVAYSDNL